MTAVKSQKAKVVVNLRKKVHPEAGAEVEATGRKAGILSPDRGLGHEAGEGLDQDQDHVLGMKVAVDLAKCKKKKKKKTIRKIF